MPEIIDSRSRAIRFYTYVCIALSNCEIYPLSPIIINHAFKSIGSNIKTESEMDAREFCKLFYSELSAQNKSKGE